VVGLAFAVLGPFVIVQSLLADYGEDLESDALSVVAIVAASLLVSGGNSFASVFFAGVLDHTVHAHRHDAEPTPVRVVARELPYGRLIGASLLAVLLTLLGMLACVIPGLLLLALLAPVGPLVTMEALRPGAAIRRSVQLVRPFLLAVFLTIIPLEFAEGTIHSLLELLPGGHAVVGELVIQVVVTALVGSYLGLVEVHTTHELLDLEAATTLAT
jgi:hypothetical protein